MTTNYERIKNMALKEMATIRKLVNNSSITCK